MSNEHGAIMIDVGSFVEISHVRQVTIDLIYKDMINKSVDKGFVVIRWELIEDGRYLPN